MTHGAVKVEADEAEVRAAQAAATESWLDVRAVPSRPPLLEPMASYTLLTFDKIVFDVLELIPADPRKGGPLRVRVKNRSQT